MSEQEQPAAEEREVVLDARGIGLFYPSGKRMTLFKRLVHRRVQRQYWALRGVSFQCHRGDVLGVVGRNGAGKSTLSMVLTGIFEPDEGSLTINGDVSALLSLGAMFRPTLSGRDNTYYFGAFLGYNRETMDRLIGEILDFSELGDFFDEPVGTYSSGMKSRLAFSIASSIEPDVLVLDEILSVGDEGFKAKCEARIERMMSTCRCIVIISHSYATIEKMCNKTLWLEQGQVRGFGNTEEVLPGYRESLKK